MPEGGEHTTLARWSVGLAEGSLALLVLASALLAGGYAVDGWNALEDTTLGALSAFGVYAGLVAALMAFIGAIVVRMRREAWGWLWLPLATLPTLLVLLVLGELFWWE